MKTALIAVVVVGAAMVCGPVWADPQDGGATASEAPAATPADAAPAVASGTSRLRMFGRNGASALLYKDSACVGGKNEEKISGGMGDAFKSFVGKSSNVSLGIAETETTRSMTRKDSFFSKLYFREIVIPADRPTSMRMGFNDVGATHVQNGMVYKSHCFGALTFIPKAGEDYEVAFTGDGKSCTLSVNRVSTKDGQTVLTPVPVTPAPEC